MNNLQLQTNVTQVIELHLSPRLLQMLKILSLPYFELVEHLSKEAEENPVLEMERRDEYVEFLRYLTSDRKIKKEADFSELPGLENIGRVEKNLTEYLLEQLELEDFEEKHKEIARELIGHIDDRGYLQNYPQLREKIMDKFDVSRPTVDKILKIIQGFEPDGVGARNLQECLLIQIESYGFENEELENILKTVIKDHLEKLENNNFGQIAADLGIPEKSVEEIKNFIKNNLNPYPGLSFGGTARQVIPSFAVEKTEKGYRLVSLEQRYGPLLSLSPTYLKMLDDPKTDEKTKSFLKEKIRRAKELIEDFSKRTETLEKIVRKIVESQTDFLEKGPYWLKPLSQKSLAEEFGVHPSTISRAVAQKYIQTPQGLYPLKFLCPRGPKGMTATRLKAMIQEIISEENKQKPLSDRQIMNIMNERGAKIDRRTVAYYRKELKIPSVTERAK